YQDVDGARRPVTAGYTIDGEGRVRVRLGSYDPSRPLVIDPVLSYSTYLGGDGDEADPLYGGVFGIAVDTAGNAYVTGATRSANFPTTAGGAPRLTPHPDPFPTTPPPPAPL